MKEIQEREHVYRTVNGSAARWRDGKFEIADYTDGKPAWLRELDAEFKAGEVGVIDPLTGEFVCAPKEERPFDLTTGQMIDAAMADHDARFEWNLDRTLKKTCGYCPSVGGIVSFPTIYDGPIQVLLSTAFLEAKWRKVED